jgi:hypothetical protein
MFDHPGATIDYRVRRSTSSSGSGAFSLASRVSTMGFGPLDFSNGFQRLIDSACCARRSGVHPFAIFCLQKFDPQIFDSAASEDGTAELLICWFSARFCCAMKRGCRGFFVSATAIRVVRFAPGLLTIRRDTALDRVGLVRLPSIGSMSF